MDIYNSSVTCSDFSSTNKDKSIKDTKIIDLSLFVILSLSNKRIDFLYKQTFHKRNNRGQFLKYETTKTKIKQQKTQVHQNIQQEQKQNLITSDVLVSLLISPIKNSTLSIIGLKERERD